MQISHIDQLSRDFKRVVAEIGEFADDHSISI